MRYSSTPGSDPRPFHRAATGSPEPLSDARAPASACSPCAGPGRRQTPSMERSRWMTNGQVIRRVNGVKNEAQLRTLGFRECEAPKVEHRTERRSRYAGR